MTDSPATARPLEGVVVVELGHSIAAPYAGFVLSELGAEVIKVENPGQGDYARGWGPPFHNDAAPHFTALNRGKRSVTVDLGDSGQLAALRALILERADVFLCNLRPGSAARKGLGSEQLLAEKPRLIYSEIGAFGRGGPLEDAPGYDPLMQACGGIMSLTGESAERPPVRVGVSMIDMGSGLWAAIGILARLLAREQGAARGGLVETSLYETALAWATIPIASVTMQPRQMKPLGSGASGIVPYQAFLCTDGWTVIGAGNDNLFAKLVRALGRPELASDPKFLRNANRVENREEIVGIVADLVSGMSQDELAALLDKAGVPAAPVRRVDQVVNDPQFKALGILQTGEDGALPTLGLPLRFDMERPPHTSAAPALGAHTNDIFPERAAAQPAAELAEKSGA